TVWSSQRRTPQAYGSNQSQPEQQLQQKQRSIPASVSVSCLQSPLHCPLTKQLRCQSALEIKLLCSSSGDRIMEYYPQSASRPDEVHEAVPPASEQQVRRPTPFLDRFDNRQLLWIAAGALVLVISLVLLTTGSSSTLLPVTVNGKVGYITSSGKLKIQP